MPAKRVGSYTSDSGEVGKLVSVKRELSGRATVRSTGYSVIRSKRQTQMERCISCMAKLVNVSLEVFIALRDWPSYWRLGDASITYLRKEEEEISGVKVELWWPKTEMDIYLFFFSSLFCKDRSCMQDAYANSSRLVPNRPGGSEKGPLPDLQTKSVKPHHQSDSTAMKSYGALCLLLIAMLLYLKRLTFPSQIISY
ncbi:hypothetical protein B0O99DRAFT_94699 [Bisporella sp. PMI_857]|nr:hypothetical protein B0O99DRAFT_94699 [Bisporella sp. PMI_857]